MNPLRQLAGLVRKEIQLEVRHRLSFVNRLLVGPLVSVLSSGMLYHGVFRAQENLSLGGLNSGNFVSTLFLGFTIHTCFNSGFYCLPGKIFQEWNARTLPLLWTAPSGQAMAVAGLAGFELMRVCAVFSLGLLIVSISQPIRLTGVIGGFSLILLVHAFAVCIGFLRAMFSFRYPAVFEILEYGFLAMTFTSCFYLPKTLLPSFLQPVCEINPGYHAMQAMRGVWFNEPTLLTHLGAFALALCFSVTACVACWQLNRERLIEKSFA